MKRQRVVVTGLGVVSSIGIGWKAFWEALLAGKSGISEVTAFDTSEFPTHRGGEVKCFRPEQFIEPSKLRRFNRASQFAIAASQMALEDGQLGINQIPAERVGIAIGTTMAEAQALEAMDAIWIQADTGRVPARLVPQYPGNMIAAHVATQMGLRGPNLVIATACAAGNYAVAYAYDLLRLHRADAMLAGGSDAFSRVAFSGFNRLFAVAPEYCQPFDKNRKGMMVGEGAGILLLERLEDALARGATIYAEVLGYGLSCDANHMTIPATEGLVQAMRKALRNADVQPHEIDYISAHGTGTPANDRTECAAIREIFGDRSSAIPISSIKSMLGHTMGAASALEAIACALTVRYDWAPPTINYETPDSECPIDCVPNQSRKTRTGVALNNAFAFGGNNACVAFGKHPP